MDLKYTLEEKDYLDFYNFNASRNETIKKRKLRSWILLSAIFFGVGIFTYFDSKENIGMMIYSFSMGAIIAVFYPFYYKWRYQKYYKNLIRTQLKDKLGVETQLVLNDLDIRVIDPQGEMKWDLNAFVEVAVVDNYIYLYVKGGGAIIVPKTKEVNVILEAMKKQNVHVKYFA